MPMSPFLLFIGQIVRWVVMLLLGYLEARGVITANVGNGVADMIINFLVVTIVSLLVYAYARWERWRAGLTAGSPHPAVNLPTLNVSPKAVNATPGVVTPEDVRALSTPPPADPSK